MAADPNLEWLGHVQPVGLVVAPAILARHGLNPTEETRLDSEVVKALLSEKEDGPALLDPWAFFEQVLDWRVAEVAGAPGGPALPDDALSVRVEESETELRPHWAVRDPDGGWQLLVRLEAAGVEPEARGVLEGWEATPHQRLERQCRETGVPTGILLSDRELRLVYAPKGETSGWMAFPLRSLAGVAGRPMLGGLKLLLNAFRLHNDATDRRLPALLKASRDAQAEVSAKLAGQVLGALHELLRGLYAADRERFEALAANRPDYLYDGLLAVLLRLVFLLYAEDRSLIPSRTDGDAGRLYESYGVRTLYGRLLNDLARHEDTMEERRGAWPRLLALFRLVHRGHGSGWIRGRGGKLFDPAAFPFLQGQERPDGPPEPAPVSDGCIFRILDGLLTLDGERLSYRTLDVEQIGSVYETVMGFTVETRPGPAVAIKAGKHDRVPVFVDVAALTAAKGKDRAKFLKDEASRNSVTDRVGKPLAAAATEAETVEALRPIIDERGSPGGQPLPPGTPLLQPTDERRRTGSHYTPRTLTEPIVRHALEPAFEGIGPDAKPEDVLQLKVCDPAMGSGAFLVEACRQLGEWLVQAWARWPETRPTIPADEDEHLHAHRLVVQRCLYGVDKNPRSVELARLSLWLATLARDHEFTFLDHALKCGDSLVGLSNAEVAAAHWDATKPGLSLFRQLVKDRVAEAVKGRSEIRHAPDDVTRAVQEARHRNLEERLQPVRTIGNAVISAFFAADKDKAREARRAEVESWLTGAMQPDWAKLAAAAASLRHGEHPVMPFHWELEFPEVFERYNPGFDAIVGNPPFAGKNTIIASSRANYLPWLQTLHEGAHGNADLVAHFFRRSFTLLRDGACLGLVATNTISQGESRATGLASLLHSGGSIYRAVRRLRWPGQAAVVVSVVHLKKGHSNYSDLDGRRVSRISAYLVEGNLDSAPAQLSANLHRAFEGSKVLGMGFTFDDLGANRGTSEDLRTMRKLIESCPGNSKRIRPYIGGEEVNSDPKQRYHRFVIDFGGLSEQEARQNWPALFDIVERRVKPQRMKDNREVYRRFWWQFAERRSGLYSTISKLNRVIVTSRVSTQFCISILDSNMVFADRLVIFGFDGFDPFCVLQARPHELWARTFGSSLKDDLLYVPKYCFRTFPFPSGFETDPALEAAGQTYHDHRAALMIARNEGMTKTYNRFHSRAETAEDIARLRELHAAMDRAVLEAYGWHDLAERVEPVFLNETNENDHTYQGRLFWPSDFRDEVLARLLALNAERHAEEVRLGLVGAGAARPRASDEDAEDELEDA